MIFDIKNGSSGIVVVLILFILMSVGVIGFIMLSDQHNEALTSDPLNSTGVLSTGSIAYNLTNQTTTTVANNGGIAIFLFIMAFIVCLGSILVAVLKR